MRSPVGYPKAEFNLRGDNGAATGGLAVDSNLGWKGPESYVARPARALRHFHEQLHRAHRDAGDVQQGNQGFDGHVREVSARKRQSESYTSAITLSQYQRFQYIREQLSREGFSIPMPSG
ncbi:hypothetical protein [Silvimonas amylolytica]|uniref:hypothetical protein n=1 Tax=Silvimonas amylolytica TaxID=449663 RepID=UPI001E4A98C6|nr:hypothetical protein [Silvimonas amylolytica]